MLTNSKSNMKNIYKFLKDNFDNLKRSFNNIFNQEESEITYSASDVDASIFREYDIRGIYGSSLLAEDALFIGKAIAYFLISEDISNKRHNEVIVGYDGRQSSIPLAKNLIKGLCSSGCYVTNIGMVPTPMLYFTMFNGSYDFGIMITGSHNPKEYNGFKLVMKDRELLGKDIQHIASLVKQGKSVEGLGREIIVLDSKNKYITALLKDIDILGNLNIAWDIGNGVAGIIVKKIIKQVPGKHTLIFDDINSDFPNRNPDPTQEENLSYLKKFVVENKCDFGIAFDGDADRFCVVTNKGQLLHGDQVLAIFAESILKTKPRAIIISDVKASKSLSDMILRLGGKFIMSKVGHSVIANKLKETKALLAGEMSGHFFFADRWFGFDDGLYSALRFIEIFSKAKDNGINIFDNLIFGFNTPEIRIDYPDDEKFNVVENLKKILDLNKIKFNDIDGVRVEMDEGWWLLRASNTQAQLTLRIEGNTEQDLEYLKKIVSEFLAQVKVNVNI